MLTYDWWKLNPDHCDWLKFNANDWSIFFVTVIEMWPRCGLNGLRWTLHFDWLLQKNKFAFDWCIIYATMYYIFKHPLGVPARNRFSYFRV